MYNQFKVNKMTEKSVFDIYSLPLHRSAGQESVKIPGLLVKDAPQRAHRSRREDILFLFLTLSGDGVLPSSQIEELLENLAGVYFKSRGTVTTSLRTVTEELNNFLLKKNQSSQGRKQQIGVLNLAVLRGKQIFVVHAGDTKSFSLGKSGIQSFYEPFTAGRGLGVSRSVQLSYFQTEINPGNLLIFCADPPQSWGTGTLEDIARLPLGQIRRRIMEPSLNDLRAVLLQFRRGKGRIYQPRAQGIKSEPVPEPAATPTEIETPASPPPVIPPPPAQEDISQEAMQVPQETNLPPVPVSEMLSPAPPMTASEETAEESRPESASKPTTPRRQRRDQSAIKEKLADLWVSGKAIQGKIKNRLSQTFGKFIPEGTSLNLPPKTMLAIAIVVPLLIAILSSAIYFTTARNDERQQLLNQAALAASNADLTSDPTLRATGWMQVLAYLDQVDSLGASEEAAQLRLKAEETLDAIHDITRLTYYPLLPPNASRDWQITSMVANESDIYMLDSVSGSVKRMYQTGKDYDFTLDEDFNCGPGTVDGIDIQRIVDISVLNKKMFDKPIPKAASILALDEAGNYLFCVPNLEPKAGTLLPPSGGWGNIKKIDVNEIGLFVLNPETNDLWFYKHDDSLEATELTYEYEESAVRLFFYNTIPDLHDVVDIVYFEKQIYLLHSAGTMTICDPWTGYEKEEDGGIEITEPTKCTNIAIDLAQYAASDAQISTAPFQHQFGQMLSNPAPFSYITILDSKQAVLYQFTTGLKTLSDKFYPKFDVEYQVPAGEPSAFTIVTPENRVILLAYGNQVFKAVP
jgi:hypothetical protein